MVQNHPTAGLPLSAPPAEAGAAAQPASGEIYVFQFLKGELPVKFFVVYRDCVTRFLLQVFQVFLHKSSFQMGKIYEQNVFRILF